MYFEVIAANFTGFYTPSFQLSGLQGDQTADIDWGVTVGAYGNNIATGAGNGIFAGTAVNTSLTNTSAGVSIYIRVTVHNNDFEGIAVTPITLAVDAVNSANQDDVLHNDCATLNPAFADAAVQNLNARPIVTEVAPNVFLPVAP
jgi:zinc transporter ZupT